MREHTQQREDIRLLDHFRAIALLLRNVRPEQARAVSPHPGDVNLGKGGVEVIALPDDVPLVILRQIDLGRHPLELRQLALAQTDLRAQAIVLRRVIQFQFARYVRRQLQVQARHEIGVGVVVGVGNRHRRP